MLMRDGVSDTEIYPEWQLKMLHDLRPRPYYKSTLENLHKSVENVAVGEAAAGEDYYLDRRTAAGPSEPTERVLTTFRGREFDVTGLGAIAEEMDPASFGESKDQETLRNRRTEFEDSAYGTASHGQSSGVKAALPTDTNAVERQIDDIGTEYSETSMTESRSLGYMEHFANDLYAVISKVQCDPQGIQTLSGLLPELLQQFALRIGQEVPRKDGREVMYYVHKHRK